MIALVKAICYHFAMSKRQKLIEKLLSGRALSFQEVDVLLQALGFSVDVSGSHHIYRNASGKRVVLPRHGAEVKQVYLKQVIEVIKDDI